MSASTSARMLRTSVARSVRSPTNVAVRARSMATKSSASASTPLSSATSSSYWTTAAATAGLVAAAFALGTSRSPVALEPRASYADRMKSKTSLGDKKLDQAAHDNKQPQPEAAEETPQTIEVVAEEASDASQQQSAYDPETGEINWDCPCLGGMAHGPCGEHFKAAFSCFVYSEQEPKGIECVEKFKAMQDCFREHPEIYKDEIEDDEAGQEADAAALQQAQDGRDGASESEEKPREKNAAVGGDKKEGGPAGSGTATVDVDPRDGPNPDKVQQDDPERRKREHDVFTNRANSGPVSRG